MQKCRNAKRIKKDIQNKGDELPMENNTGYFENRPVTMNEHNNLLQIEEHMYQLQDVEKPNAFRNMFPYDEIP